MTNPQHSRRSFLQWSSAAALAVHASLEVVENAAAAAPEAMTYYLDAMPGQTRLSGRDGPTTDIWCYNHQVPGPILRFRVGDLARIVVKNSLPQATTVHWHGLRVPNAMDGVPNLTQSPVMPAQIFTYEFTIRNSGTYLYHAHYQTAKQLDRGLAGIIVVEDDVPIVVDRDLIWVLDDWRLKPDGAVSESLDDMHGISHDGGLGDVITINGSIPDTVHVTSGERVRIRLANTANARIFALDFNGHRPYIVAHDGHAVRPYSPNGNIVSIGPMMRVDVVIDMDSEPGSFFTVVDRGYPTMPYDLLRVAYAEKARRRASLPGTSIALVPPNLPRPDIPSAVRHRIRLESVMSGLPDALLNGVRRTRRELADLGKAWALNGVVASDQAVAPMLSLDRGQSCVIEFQNNSVVPHPMSLHGHAVRVLSRNGIPVTPTIWQDTVLVGPRERVDVAFVADNPGKWMLHCQTPEHAEAGMMGVVAVG